ncbi:MAG TPA: GNAT family N-acetyltransferase [Bradyrhizobium sp.]|jgi:ribosomal protein S18 acetylase RimI-like enzyme|nr:GNAT family N-acetyltransferase [Bradyrhizobium sp.]
MLFDEPSSSCSKHKVSQNVLVRRIKNGCVEPYSLLRQETNMCAAHIEIRRLTQADSDLVLYRDIRLEALKANPEAFGSTFEIEDAQPSSWFSARLGSSELLGVFCDAKLVATAGFAIQQGQKKAHKGTMWGMYVRPAARRTGIGRLLVEAIVDLARRRVELIQLTVVRDNERARRLYASHGFREYGVEKNALKQDGRYYDEVLMAKDLLEKSS